MCLTNLNKIVMSPKDKKNRTIAFSVSIGIHLLLLITWGAVMAWEAPGPPAEFPEIGIEVAYGSDLVGKESEEEIEIENESPSDNQEEVTEEETADISEAIPAEDTPESTSEQNNTSESDVVPDVTSDIVEPVNQTSTPSVETNTSNEPTKVTETQSNTSSGAPKIFKGDGEEAGEKGNEEGVRDVKTYDGDLGGGDLGQSIGNINGFSWKKKPKMDKVPFDATVKMKVVVNNLGEIITVKFMECPYTDPAVKREIENQLKKATLQATSQPDGNTVANITWAFKGK